MSGHTPGPWSFNKVSGEVISGFGNVALVFGWNDPDDETEPSGRLIAAAPDLLAAANLAVIGLTEGGTESDRALALEALERALAKAEGKGVQG